MPIPRLAVRATLPRRRERERCGLRSCPGGEQFTIDLQNVREVFVVESITPVPGMPAGLVGVTNLRGSVVPLLDLRQMIGLAAENAQRYAVVVKHGNWQVGVLVDTVPEIRTLSKDQFLPAPVGTGDGESLRIDRREPGRPAAWRVGDVRRSFSF